MYTNIHSIHTCTASLWNKLPGTIKETQSLDTFKSNPQYPLCTVFTSGEVSQ